MSGLAGWPRARCMLQLRHKAEGHDVDRSAEAQGPLISCSQCITTSDLNLDDAHVALEYLLQGPRFLDPVASAVGLKLVALHLDARQPTVHQASAQGCIAALPVRLDIQRVLPPLRLISLHSGRCTICSTVQVSHSPCRLLHTPAPPQTARSRPLLRCRHTAC